MGIYAAIKDNHLVLVVFGVFMSLIFLIQLITGITGLSVKNSSNYNTYVDNVFAKEFKHTTPLHEERDFYQKHFSCCGWQSPEDYRNSTTTELEAPTSCCANMKTCDSSKIENLFKVGCNVKLYDASRFVIETACTILVIFAFFNLVSIVLSFVLSRQIRVGYQYT